MIQSNIVVRQKRGIILFYSEGEFTSLEMSEKTKTPQERGFCLRERLFFGERESERERERERTTERQKERRGSVFFCFAAIR